MEILLLALTIGLPLIKILLFPARTMGRGGNWKFVGAAMIVALMMALWFGMQSVSDSAGDANAATAQATDGSTLKQADIDALAKLLN